MFIFVVIFPCTINTIIDYKWHLQDRNSLIDDSRVTFQIVVSLIDEIRGVIYNHKMFSTVRLYQKKNKIL
jgi:hypothetical protein